MEETPAESSEDELVAPSQVTARVGLELVPAALDFSYSLGRVSKIPFLGKVLSQGCPYQNGASAPALGSREEMQMEYKTRPDKTIP